MPEGVKAYGTFQAGSGSASGGGDEDGAAASAAAEAAAAQEASATFDFAERNNDSHSSSSSSSCSSCRRVASENALLVALVTGIGCGVALGAGLRSIVSPQDARAIMYIGFPGEVLMRMLKLLILPLIVSSLVSAVGGLDASASSRLGVRALAYYAATTAAAMVVGMAMALTLRPGGDGKQPPGATTTSPAEDTEALQHMSAIDPLLDLIRNMFPENLIEACFSSSQTKLMATESNGTGYTPVVQKVQGSANVLGLVVYSLVLGCVLVRLGPIGKPLAAVMLSLQEATMLMVSMAIWYSPVGILSLVAAEIVRMADPMQAVAQLGLYAGTVLGGLALHGLVLLPLLYVCVTRRSPLPLFAGTAPAMATAFGTSSSSATLPVTYRCLEDSVGIDKRVTRFILPIGATVNMNGTALYEAVAPIFIAQLNGIELSFGELIAISLTATCAAVGAAGIPQAGLVTMIVVLNAVGLPTNDIAKVFTVDWLLDRFRTMINVLGDCFGAGVLAHVSKSDLSRWALETPLAAAAS